jgi:hypothetical protein
LNDRSPRPDRVWNRIPDGVRDNVVQLALDEPALSPRELGVAGLLVVVGYHPRRAVVRRVGKTTRLGVGAARTELCLPVTGTTTLPPECFERQPLHDPCSNRPRKGYGVYCTTPVAWRYQSFRRDLFEKKSLDRRLDTLLQRVLGKHAAECPQRGFTSTFTKFWLVGARGKMSGPESPPIGGLGEASWAFEVMLVVVPAVVVPSIVPDAVGDV